MSSKERHRNKRIRETISSLADDQLIKMLQDSPLDYTPFALRVAREELSKRKLMATLQKDMAAAREPAAATSQNDSTAANPGSCYIEVWRDKSFEGEYLRIEGPAQYDCLRSAAADWGDDIGSLRVGPNAFVIAYEDKNYKGRKICFGPGEEAADLSGFRFEDQIDSIKVINSMRIFDDIRLASVGMNAEAEEVKEATAKDGDKEKR